MMGEQLGRQDRLFYQFCHDDRVPGDHLLLCQLSRILALCGLGGLSQQPRVSSVQEADLPAQSQNIDSDSIFPKKSTPTPFFATRKYRGGGAGPE